jgi:hypothetical protein
MPRAAASLDLKSTCGLPRVKLRWAIDQRPVWTSCCLPLKVQNCNQRITGTFVARKEQALADSTKERLQAEAQFKRTQKQKEGAAATADYAAQAAAVRAKTARLRELRLAKEAADKLAKPKK